jgi:hypothetical protein
LTLAADKPPRILMRVRRARELVATFESRGSTSPTDDGEHPISHSGRRDEHNSLLRSVA